MKSQAGFTIAELLVVMAIIALVSAVSMPLVIRREPTASLHTEFRNLLQRARAKALTERKPVDVIIDTTRRTAMLNGHDAKLPWSPAETVTIKAVRSPAQTGTVLFRFFANGTSSGGDVSIGNAPASRVITVNWLTGAIRMSEPEK